MKNLRPDPLGQAEHVDRAVDAGLGRLDRVELVVDGRGRARQVVNLVHLQEKGMHDVVAQQLESLVAEQVLDVAPASGEEVVNANEVFSTSQELLAEVASQKSCPTGDEDGLHATEGSARWGACKCSGVGSRSMEHETAGLRASRTWTWTSTWT